MRALILAAACGGAFGIRAERGSHSEGEEKTTKEKLVGKWKLVKTDGTLFNGVPFYIEEFKPNGGDGFSSAVPF